VRWAVVVYLATAVSMGDVVDKQAERFVADIADDPELGERNGDDIHDQENESDVFCV